MLLSIVIPFFNSHAKSRRLMETLRSLSADDVEVMLIDDGGSLAESELLKADAESLQVSHQLVRQRNSGPGTARNKGMCWANGRYVWFVDSDDDFSPAAIDCLREHQNVGYDFLDFQISHARDGTFSTMRVEDGPHTDHDQRLLLNGFGRCCTKIFRRAFLLDYKLFYPENCLYEDNALALFLPLYARRFYKSDVVGYFHQTELASATRSMQLSPKYFDRLETAEYGLKRALSFRPMNRALRQAIIAKFSNMFLRITVRGIRHHGANALHLQRVMRLYKDIMRPYDPDGTVMDAQMNGVLKTVADPDEQAIIRLLWDSTDMIGDPRPHFAAIRAKTWKRDILFREKPIPPKKQPTCSEQPA